jgi:hypothetical protein
MHICEKASSQAALLDAVQAARQSVRIIAKHMKTPERVKQQIMLHL